MAFYQRRLTCGLTDPAAQRPLLLGSCWRRWPPLEEAPLAGLARLQGVDVDVVRKRLEPLASPPGMPEIDHYRVCLVDNYW